MTATYPPPVAVLLNEDHQRAALAADVRRGLDADVKWLPAKWLYDERGCALFEQITALPDYYPNRAERAILAAHSDDVAAATGAGTLMELGSGTSEKTLRLLDALRGAGTLTGYVAFDVAEATLRQSLAEMAVRYPGIDLAGVVGDFGEHLQHLPDGKGRILALLGGTLGNLEPANRRAFLHDVAGVLHGGEWFLVGADLVKDPARLVAAYDDAGGVTAAFELNVLDVVNQALHADFVLDRFAYVARWNTTYERIEMGVVSRGAQRVRVADLDLVVDLADGEEIRTELSCKFRPDGLAAELDDAGLSLEHVWTDPAGDFSLALARREDS